MALSSRHAGIPTDIIRTIVVISEEGSFSKAALRLKLSQPAISSQVKRIEEMLGGQLFDRQSGHLETTNLGKLTLNKARIILEANDQMLGLGGLAIGPDVVRLGLSTLFVRPFMMDTTRQELANVHLMTDHSTKIAQGLLDGYIDVACIFENPAIPPELNAYVVAEYDEQLVWVCGPTFSLNADVPVPLLTWPGDHWMVPTLDREQIKYRVAMESPDYFAKEAAVEAGLGITVIPSRMVPSTLKILQTKHLPRLPTFKALLCVRPGEPSVKKLQADLSSLFF